MRRQLYSSGTSWEPVVGYSRAVRVDGRIWVSGTTSTGSDGAIVGKGDPYAQAKRCLEIILAALEEVGAGPEHVVRTRAYLTNADDWKEVGRAHGEVFAEVRPASAMIVVSSLLDPRWLVELEADALVG